MTNAIFARRIGAACLATTMLTGIAGEAFGQIEEIIVTTRKRAENLQDVPIVVTAFTAETLQRRGLSELDDVIKYTSGVQFDEGFSAQDTRIVVRGLSPTRGRPNVAFLQDDVDISSEAINTAGSSFLINPRLFDVERIEIVKGPHSALFGRSAFAGAINYITKKPGDEVEGTANIDIGSYGKIEGRAGVSGPVIEDRLSLGINAALWHFSGYYRNSVSGEKIGGGEGEGVALSGVWTPSDALKATARVEYSDDHFDPQARAQIAANTNAPIPAAAQFLANPRLNGVFPILTGPAPDASDVTVRMSRNPRTGEDYPGNDRRIWRATLRLEYDMNEVLFTSISHYGDARTTQFEDAQRQGDFNAIGIAAETNFVTDVRLLSEEIRLQSQSDGPLQWTAGAMFWNETARQDNLSFTCFVPTGFTCGPLVRQIGTDRPFASELYVRDTHHYSIYGLVEYDITEQLNLSVELRHTWEDEDLVAPATVDKTLGCQFMGASLPFRPLQLDGVTTRCVSLPGPPLPPVFRVNQVVGAPIFPETRSKFWAPRFSINYTPTEDMLIYASAAKGVKPGGVSTISGGAAGISEADNRFEAEKIWVYEAGLKSDWMDNKLQINSAVYYQDFSDKQISTQLLLPNGSLGTRIINASSARVYGWEVDAGFAFSDNLTASLGYTLLDGKYKDFKTTVASLGSITNAGNCIPLNAQLQPTAPFTTCEVDRSGNKLEDQPTHSLQLTPTWTAPFADGVDYFIEASVNYTSKRYDTEDENFFFRSYWLVDARAGFTSEQGWEIVGYVNNVFDDDKIKTGFASPDFARSYCLGGPPCNFIPPLSAGRFNFVLPNHFTASLPDKRQFGMRATYKF
ncbi:MAG: TonB-dependent receptor [Rhodospirillaceae bacterium]|nr:TonB-dependent receptor [Rhodospirillaceae bacterium]